jgi:hypothetical protein
VRLVPDAQRGGFAVLQLRAFLPRPGTTRRLDVDVNGNRAGSWVFDESAPAQQVRIPLDGGTGAQHIVLHIERPQSPRELGLSEDARQLGFALSGIITEPKS